MRLKTIGILGGMGPAASANFLRLFIREMQAHGMHKDSDFPRMIYLNLPLDNFGISGAEDKAAVSKQVTDGVSWLLKSGAEIVAIPCNSVHEFWPFDVSPSLVLNIIDETLARCSGRRIGVLCSRQTHYAKLYEHRGYTCLYSHQGLIDITIGKIMSGKEATLNDLLDTFTTVDDVVLGCTELSLCNREGRGHIVDSAQCLAEALTLHLL